MIRVLPTCFASAGIAIACALVFAPTDTRAATFGGSDGIEMGGLVDYLYVFLNGSDDTNINSGPQIGDIAVSETADTRSSGDWDYQGNIVSGHTSSDDAAWEWDRMVSGDNLNGTVEFNQQSQIDQLNDDFTTAVTQAEGLTATSGFESRSSSSLNNLDTTGLADKLFVINVTSEFSISNAININGNADQFFVLRWDEGAYDPTGGYNGQVKFNGTTGITPSGDLTEANFLHLAGDLNSSGGSGGFFNGYWLTFGKNGTLASPDETSSFSNARFNGGWYTNTNKLSLVSGSEGTYVAPLSVSEEPAVVPLPAAVWLLLSGFAAVGLAGCRRRSLA